MLLVDPRAYRRRPRRKLPELSQEQVAVLDDRTATMLAVELRTLAPLAAWQPVGGRIEALTDALRGLDGQTRADIGTLRRMAARWRRLDPAVREFYADAAPRVEAVSITLWFLLTGRPRPEGAVYGRVHAEWRAFSGVDASTSLFPVTWKKRRYDAE